MEPPPDIDDALVAHASRVRSGRPSIDPGVHDRLAQALAALQAIEIGRQEISLESTRRGGVVAKKVVGRVVRPQVDGVLDQLRRQQDAIEGLAGILVDVVDALVRDVDGILVQQIDDLQVRVAELRREVNAARSPE